MPVPFQSSCTGIRLTGVVADRAETLHVDGGLLNGAHLGRSGSVKRVRPPPENRAAPIGAQIGGAAAMAEGARGPDRRAPAGPGIQSTLEQHPATACRSPRRGRYMATGPAAISGRPTGSVPAALRGWSRVRGSGDSDRPGRLCGIRASRKVYCSDSVRPRPRGACCIALHRQWGLDVAVPRVILAVDLQRLVRIEKRPRISGWGSTSGATARAVASAPQLSRDR